MIGAEHRAARVAPEATYQLRRSVLDRLPTTAERHGDVADWGHYGVVIHGSLVATGVTHPLTGPATLGEQRAQSRRIIGMAVDPHRQRQGFGSLVLAALLDHVHDAGGCLAWCHARVDTASFYLRHGFTEYPIARDDTVAGRQVLLGSTL